MGIINSVGNRIGGIAIQVRMESVGSLETTQQRIDNLLKTYINTSILILIADVQSVPYVGVKYHIKPSNAQQIVESRLQELKETLENYLENKGATNVEVAYWHEIINKAYNQKMSLTKSTYNMMRDFHNAITDVVKEMFSEHLSPEEIDAIAPQILGEMVCLVHGIHFNGHVYELVEVRKSVQNIADQIRNGHSWPWILHGTELSAEEVGQ